MSVKVLIPRISLRSTAARCLQEYYNDDILRVMVTENKQWKNLEAYQIVVAVSVLKLERRAVSKLEVHFFVLMYFLCFLCFKFFFFIFWPFCTLVFLYFCTFSFGWTVHMNFHAKSLVCSYEYFCSYVLFFVLFVLLYFLIWLDVAYELPSKIWSL